MDKIFKTFEKNSHKKTFFIDIDIIDWYDTPLSGFAKIRNLNEWYLFFVTAWNLKTDDKVFIFLNVGLDFIKEWKKSSKKMEFIEIKKKFSNIISKNTSTIYLYKAKDLYSVNYDVKKIDSNEAVYIDNIEDLVNQINEENLKWFKYFK
jgi:glycerol-3-phosphate responsive antiterminator